MPPLPTGYNNNYQIVQTPGLVAILHEEIHETRLIPLDGRPHVSSSITQWLGDSRGHWEGDTLVVETTNFRKDTTFRFPVDTATLRIVERFRRVGPEDVDYQFTVDNPTMYTRPWTATLPMRHEDGLIYEYACHEGNYAIGHVLAGFRAQEKEAAAKMKVVSVRSAVVAFPIGSLPSARSNRRPCVQQGNTQHVCGQTAPEDLCWCRI